MGARRPQRIRSRALVPCWISYPPILFCADVCAWNDVPRQQASAEQLAWNYLDGGSLNFVGCGRMGSYHYVGGTVVSDGVR
jgi:hypothetical protein